MSVHKVLEVVFLDSYVDQCPRCLEDLALVVGEFLAFDCLSSLVDHFLVCNVH